MWKLIGVRRALFESPFQIPLSIATCLLGMTLVFGPRALVPDTVQEVFPAWLLYAWALCFFFGGIGTFVGKVYDQVYLERGFLVLMGTPWLLYAIILSAAGQGASLAAATCVLGISTGCFLRVWILSTAVRASKVSGMYITSPEDTTTKE